MCGIIITMIGNYTDTEDEVIRKNFGIVPTSRFINLLPGRTTDSVRHRATRRLGLTHGDTSKLISITKTRYSFTHQFFDHPNIICSYWAGFIAADGCVYKNTLSINLAIKDRNHLEQFSDAIGFTGPIIDSMCQYGIQSTLRIHGAKDTIDALNQNYKITPRKSLTLQPPRELDQDNTLAFILGYIDGDGCIRITSQGYLRAYILGTNSVLSWIKEVFDNIIQDTTNYPKATVKKSVDSRNYTYTLTGRRFISVAKELLKIPIPRMERKWKIARPFTN